MITVSNPILQTTTVLNGVGQSKGNPVTFTAPYQVMGFSPLTPCDIDECRYWDPDCCIKNPVFAQTGTGNIYNNLNNDSTAYLICAPTYSTGSTNSTTMTFVLQKWNGSAWINTVGLGNNNYGTFYNFYSLAISTYRGYIIEWRKVLDSFGEGCYRFYVSFGMYGREGCLTGEPFSLLIYSCQHAHGTVRFDSMIFDGTIASIDIDGFRFDLCGLLWRDQFRVYGFFGDEESDEDKRQLELTDGKILKTHDRLNQKFSFTSSVMPKWFHDRFKCYGTMADELRVTDYNWNNSDYLIKMKLIVREGGVKPDYKRSKRNYFAKYVFMEGYQDVSRSLCCDNIAIKR